MLPELNRRLLWDSINDFMTLQQENHADERLLQPMSSVLNLLFHPTEWAGKPEVDAETRKKELTAKATQIVNNGNNLIGYTFYLHSSQQFSYNWSYLLKKIEGFEELLVNFELFVDELITVLNILFQGIHCRLNDLTFEINGFLKIYSVNDTYVVELILPQFHKVLNECLKDSMSITAYIGDTILGAYRCSGNLNAPSIANIIENAIVKGKHI